MAIANLFCDNNFNLKCNSLLANELDIVDIKVDNLEVKNDIEAGRDIISGRDITAVRNLSCVAGTLTGALSAGATTVTSLVSSGSISGTNGTLSGTLNVSGASTQAAINCSSIVDSGTLSCTSLSCSSVNSSGAISGTTGTFSGNLACAQLSPTSIVNSGALSSTNGTFSGTLNVSGSSTQSAINCTSIVDSGSLSCASITNSLDNSSRRNFQIGNWAEYSRIANQTITSGVSTKISFSVGNTSGVTGDPTLSSGSFVINRTGTYRLCGQVTVINNGAAALVQQRVTILLNAGTSTLATIFADELSTAGMSGAIKTIPFNILCNCAATDTLQVNYSQNSGANQTVQGALVSVDTWMYITYQHEPA